MPYKNIDRRRQVARESMKRKRMLTPVNPVLTPVRPHHVNPSNPKIDELRNLIKSIESKEYVKPMDDVQPEIPLYNPVIHKAGDKVLVKRGSRLVVAVIPKMDAEGCIIPEYE